MDWLMFDRLSSRLVTLFCHDVTSCWLFVVVLDNFRATWLRNYAIVGVATLHTLCRHHNQPITMIVLMFCCRQLVPQVWKCFGDRRCFVRCCVCCFFAQKNTKLDKIVKMLIYLFCLLSSEACLLWFWPQVFFPATLSPTPVVTQSWCCCWCF